MTITVNSQEVPVKIVGSSVYGRYPTISAQRTFNMFISTAEENKEQWLVNFAGYDFIRDFFGGVQEEGRALYHSVRGGFLLAVVAATVFRLDTVTGIAFNIGQLATNTGEVYIDENLSSQIALVDGQNVYIYNYLAGGNIALANLLSGIVTFIPTDFQANYVTYQNTHFIFGNGLKTNTGSQWFVFGPSSNPLTNPYDLVLISILNLQTKPDYAIAALRVPGKGNNLIVFGTTVAELWTDVGSLAVYQRVSSINIDYGCVSVSTISSADEIIAWLSINEKASPVIMITQGGKPQAISTDGIDFLLETVKFPEQSTAFFYRQDGHLFYVLTFFNPNDNLTILYDFTTNHFFDLTDWDFSYFPARQTTFFNNDTYFISIKDGGLYAFGSDLTTYETGTADNTIPRVRVCDTFRLPRPEKFLVNLFTFVIESGTTPNASVNPPPAGTNLPRIDVTISKDGGITFGNAVPYYMKGTGFYRNQPRFLRLGYCSQFTPQLRFWGLGRFVVHDGVLEVRQ